MRSGNAAFDGARLSLSSFSRQFADGVDHPALPRGEEEGWLYLVGDEDSSKQPTEAPADGPA